MMIHLHWGYINIIIEYIMLIIILIAELHLSNNYHSIIEYVKPEITFLKIGKNEEYLTFCTMPLKLNSEIAYNQTLFAISSWLVVSKKITVTLYNHSIGWGEWGSKLFSTLNMHFAYRVYYGGIIKSNSSSSEFVGDVLERIATDSKTKFVAFISNDIYLHPSVMNAFDLINDKFGDYDNFSIHVPRRELNKDCRTRFDFTRLFSRNWTNYFGEIIKNCYKEEHDGGFDVILFNKKGYKDYFHEFPLFKIGRPHYDGYLCYFFNKHGYYVTTTPFFYSYHFDHPERKRFVYMRNKDNDINHGLSKQKVNRPDCPNNSFDFRTNGFFIEMVDGSGNWKRLSNFSINQLNHPQKSPRRIKPAKK